MLFGSHVVGPVEVMGERRASGSSRWKTSKGNAPISDYSTGIGKASEIARTVPTRWYWVTSSTTLM